jgi:DNA polymerase-1
MVGGSFFKMDNLLFLDTETHMLGPGNMAPKVVCLSWARPQGDSGLVHHTDVEEWFKKHVIDTDVTIIGHNMAYDTGCLAASYPALLGPIFDLYENNRVYCTQVRERLLNIAVDQFVVRYDAQGRKHKSGYSLNELCARYLDLNLDKGEDGWRLRYKELEDTPLADWPKRAVDYAVNDSVYGLQVFFAQRTRARDMHYAMPTQDLETRADFSMRLMSAWGLHTDPSNVSKLRQHIELLLPDLKTKLIENKILKSSNKKGKIVWSKDMAFIRERIAASYPGEPPRSDKTNVIETGKKVLEKCTDKALAGLVQFSSLEKLNNTFVKTMTAGIGRPIHARFNVLGAESGRTSCSNPNLQNQPKLPGVRECYVARDGYYFLACDFESQESRTLAQTCYDLLGSSTLRDRYSEDPQFDPHLELAALLLGVDLDRAKTLYAEGDAEIKRYRQRAKAANFGFPGGLGVDAFLAYAKGWKAIMTLDEAAELKDNWFLQWPEMRLYFKHISQLVASGEGDVMIPQSGFIRGGCRYTSAANTYFQGLAAHASKNAMWEVTRRCYNKSLMRGCRPVVFIHDEIILEVPCSRIDIVARELKNVMVDAMQVYTPDVPAAAKASAMKHWSKEAEPKFVNGKLVPWDL